jgi:hypothetical protein
MVSNGLSPSPNASLAFVIGVMPNRGRSRRQMHHHMAMHLQAILALVFRK